MLRQTRTEVPGPVVQCSCGARLVSPAEIVTGEIETVCPDCGCEFAVNGSAAGETMPCRCGAEVQVPHCVLIDAPEVEPLMSQESKVFVPEVPTFAPETDHSEKSPEANAALDTANNTTEIQSNAVVIADPPTAPPDDEQPAVSVVPDQQVDVRCPGCQRRYPVPKSELGQTGECECGFMFVMQSNIDALDSAFCDNLMPFPPLAIDRTGAVGVREQVSSDSHSRQHRPKPVVERKVTPAETNRSRFSGIAIAIGWALRCVIGYRRGWLVCDANGPLVKSDPGSSGRKGTAAQTHRHTRQHGCQVRDAGDQTRRIVNWIVDECGPQSFLRFDPRDSRRIERARIAWAG